MYSTSDAITINICCLPNGGESYRWRGNGGIDGRSRISSGLANSYRNSELQHVVCMLFGKLEIRELKSIDSFDDEEELPER